MENFLSNKKHVDFDNENYSCSLMAEIAKMEAILLSGVEGKGTTFEIYLPFLQNETKKKQLLLHNFKLRSQMKSLDNILLIDDSEFDIVINRAILKKIGLSKNIVSVPNGKEGIDFIKDNFNRDDKTKTLVLLDLNMPVMNGFEFLEALSEINISENLHVLVLSSSNDSSDINEAMRLGADGYLVKPLKKEELNLIIDKIQVQPTTITDPWRVNHLNIQKHILVNSRGFTFSRDFYNVHTFAKLKKGFRNRKIVNVLGKKQMYNDAF